MTVENFKSHTLFEKLDQLGQRLNDEEVSEKIDLENMSFYQSAYKYISDRIKLTIPLLVQEAEMNALSSELDQGLQQINSFIGNNNIGHLTNATNNINSSLTRIRNFPLPYAKNDFNFSKAIADFQDSVSKKYELVEAENNELTNSIETFKLDLENKESEIERLFKLLEEKETEISNLNSNFQVEFDNIKTKNNEVFEGDRSKFRSEIETDKEAFRTEIQDIKEGIDTDTSKLIDDLNDKLSEAKKIVSIIGNVGITGNYKIIANEHKSAANFWRWIAIGFMTLLSGLLVWTIIDLAEQGFDWTKSLIRILGAAALSYPATYAAKESSKHRKLETINRTSELELASINPFIESLDDTKKQEIKVKLVEKYFGNSRSEIETSEKEEVSISGFEKIIKTILPLIKK